jgi:hypothetical protein
MQWRFGHPNRLLEKGACMIRLFGFLPIASIGLTCVACSVGEHHALPPDADVRMASAACDHHSGRRCVIPVRYAYPAGELGVSTEDAFFY